MIQSPDRIKQSDDLHRHKSQELMSPAPEDLFDDVVIGSSPMMLCRALELAAEGRRVCVLERQVALGGVWRSVRVAEEINVEVACHLIEDFPGVYEYLEQMSGIPFVPQKDQPIRVLRSGATVRYSSRRTILLSVLWAGMLLARHAFRRVGRMLDEKEEAKVHVLRRKWGDFLRFQLPVLLRGSCIRAPLTGYTDFISVLKERGCDQGVVFREFGVDGMFDDGAWWRLTDEQGRSVAARRVHCTTSANLVRVGPGRFETVDAPAVFSSSLLVEVPEVDMKEATSYAAFWSDPEVVRVARIDRREPRLTGLLYLIQLRQELSGAAAAEAPVAALIRDSLVRARVMHPDGRVRLIGRIECSFTPHRQQLADGEIDRDFHGYYSAGNLASGLARWLASRRLEARDGRWHRPAEVLVR